MEIAVGVVILLFSLLMISNILWSMYKDNHCEKCGKKKIKIKIPFGNNDSYISKYCKICDKDLIKVIDKN